MVNASKRILVSKNNKPRHSLSVLGLILFFIFPQILFATTYVLSEGSHFIGEVEYAYPEDGETLGEIGLRFGIGYYEMCRANPGINPHVSLSEKTKVLIPSQYRLPAAPHEGIVINLAEYRLYFFPKHENVVMTFPIGIGRKGWETPRGSTHIVAKEINPTWRPSKALQKEAEKNGVLLPDAFPSSRANPLGKYILRLGWPSYLIHSSPYTPDIGYPVSAGCIRMLPDDMAYLYSLVKPGLPVHVVFQPRDKHNGQ